MSVDHARQSLSGGGSGRGCQEAMRAARLVVIVARGFALARSAAEARSAARMAGWVVGTLPPLCLVLAARVAAAWWRRWMSSRDCWTSRS
jgi:hypothetical protein